MSAATGHSAIHIDGKYSHEEILGPLHEDRVNVRLIQWAEWARSSRQQAMTANIEAVEKAVGHLRFHDEPKLKIIVTEFYLNRRSVEAIAELVGDSEHHCIEFLRRALSALSESVPRWDDYLQAPKSRG